MKTNDKTPLTEEEYVLLGPGAIIAQNRRLFARIAALEVEAATAKREALEMVAVSVCDFCREYPSTVYRSKRGDWGHKIPSGDADPYYIRCRAHDLRELLTPPPDQQDSGERL